MSPEELFNQILVYPLVYLVGLVVVIILGYPIKWLLDHVSDEIDTKLPYGAKEMRDLEDWKKKIESTERGGLWLGYLERTISYLTFLLEAYTLLIAWLAFKVASKWEVWSNINKVPDDPESEEYDFNIWERRMWATRILQRFNIGTLSNILAGLIGVLITNLIIHFYQSFI